MDEYYASLPGCLINKVQSAKGTLKIWTDTMLTSVCRNSVTSVVSVWAAGYSASSTLSRSCTFYESTFCLACAVNIGWIMHRSGLWGAWSIEDRRMERRAEVRGMLSRMGEKKIKVKGEEKCSMRVREMEHEGTCGAVMCGMPPVCLHDMHVLRPVDMLVLISLAGCFPAWVQSGFFHSSFRIVARGDWLARSSWLVVGQENASPPIRHDEGGNGTAGQARNKSLHASQTTKIEVRQVWKCLARLPLAFHDIRRTHAELERGESGGSYAILREGGEGERKREEQSKNDKGDRQAGDGEGKNRTAF